MCSAYGTGYLWSPVTATVSVGDTVVWTWQAPAFVQGLGYRVFSVDSPSSINFDGVSFNSGNSKTATGIQTITPYAYFLFSSNVKPKYLCME